jgi:hypothetical protein
MKKVVKPVEPYIPPIDNYFWFYLGEEYYKRMQPTPYKNTPIDLKPIKSAKSKTKLP